jgi:hypothetical protein
MCVFPIVTEETSDSVGQVILGSLTCTLRPDSTGAPVNALLSIGGRRILQMPGSWAFAQVNARLPAAEEWE